MYQINIDFYKNTVIITTMNLIDVPDCLTINGKKLTQPQKNLLAKIQKDYGFDIKAADLFCVAAHIPVARQNRVSGVVVDNLNPLVSALVDFVYEAYGNYERVGRMIVNGKEMAIQTFDRVKYLVLALDSRAYNELID